MAETRGKQTEQRTNILSRPNEKPIFLFAVGGVFLAALALFMIPACAPSDTSTTSAGADGATTRPTTQPATRPASGTAAADAGMLASEPRVLVRQPMDLYGQGYQELLDTYLDDRNFVNYAALKNEARDELQLLVNIIAGTDPAELMQLTDDELAAWYVNAYNILTLDLIVDNYPLESIMDLDQPWDRKMTIAQQQLSLNELEHDLLRLQDEPEDRRRAFVDPRLHFAVNCASIGCPILQEEVFRGDSLDAQYDEGVREFMELPRNYRWEDGTLYLTQLLDWYGEDFELIYEEGTGTKEAIGRFFAEYEDRPAVAERLRDGDFEIEWMEYDWALNEA